MTYNIDFNICAFILSGAMLFVYHYKKGIPNIQNKLFSILLWFCFIATIADIGDGIVTSHAGGIPIVIHKLIIYLYFLTANSMPALFAFYVAASTEIKGKPVSGKSLWLFCMPAVITALIVLLNPFTDWLFYFNNEGQYCRGDGVLALNVLAFYFVVLSLIYVTVYRQVIAHQKRIALYSYAVLVSAPVVIQYLVPGLPITMFATAVCLFLVFMTIQSPEEVMSTVGLLNRRALINTAPIYFQQNMKFVVVSVHINDYQYFENIFGAGTMMRFLSSLAHRVDHFYIKGKEAFYLGDGKFALLFLAEEMKDRLPYEIIEIFDSKVVENEIAVNFSASATVIYCPQDVQDANTLIRYVDYSHKNNGLEEPVKYASDFELASAARVQEIEQAIERALTEDSFSVYYQPIYSVKEKRVASLEALVRLRDEKLGNIYPDEFIPISEHNGSIIRIGMIVFKKACQFFIDNDLKEQGIDYVEINLSVIQCMQQNLADQFLLVLRDYGLSTQYINLEITETAAAESPEMMEITIKKLSQAGMKFSLDDYGTGYSSMSSLIELPFYLVKLDKEVISKLHYPNTQVLVSNTIDMLKKLNYKVVAEGVETAKQAELLKGMGCDYLQGYYFAKPVPGEQLLSQIQEIHGRK